MQDTQDKIAILEKESHAQNFWGNAIHAGKVIKQINSLKSTITQWETILQEIENLETFCELVQENNSSSYSDEIQQEYNTLIQKFSQLKIYMFFSNEIDINNSYISIQTGAGGTESCDWVTLLLRLYIRWCERKQFKVKELDIQSSEGGIKSVLLEVQGEYAYGYLKAETGIHRLVRISPFDSSNRRHTTFASVHALPILQDITIIDIRPEEIRVDTYRSSGAGGQHVNKTDSAVRITHLETGIVVQCQNERSQIKNKQTALKILQSRLFDYYEQKKQEERSSLSPQKLNISWGSQIRSYVFHPYNLVKDHRTNIEMTDVQKVMDGEIDSFIEAYLESIV